MPGRLCFCVGILHICWSFATTCHCMLCLRCPPSYVCPTLIHFTGSLINSAHHQQNPVVPIDLNRMLGIDRFFGGVSFDVNLCGMPMTKVGAGCGGCDGEGVKYCEREETKCR